MMCLLTTNCSLQGLGRFSKNWLLSFLEDSHFPFPFGQKPLESGFKPVQDKWRRRVDLNMSFYLALILALIGLNIFFSLQGSNPQQVATSLEGYSNQTIGNFIMAWQTFTYPGFPGQIMQITAGIVSNEMLHVVGNTVEHDFNGHVINGIHEVNGKKCYYRDFYLVN